MFVIRPATERDLGQMRSLFEVVDQHHASALPQMFRADRENGRSDEFLAGILANPEAALLVCASGDQLTGLVHVSIRQSPDIPILAERRFAVIENLVVHRDFRGRGLGKLLVEAAHRWIMDHDVSDVELHVFEFNEDAIALYERLGYTTLSRRLVRRLPDQALPGDTEG